MRILPRPRGADFWKSKRKSFSWEISIPFHIVIKIAVQHYCYTTENVFDPRQPIAQIEQLHCCPPNMSLYCVYSLTKPFSSILFKSHKSLSCQRQIKNKLIEVFETKTTSPREERKGERKLVPNAFFHTSFVDNLYKVTDLLPIEKHEASC